MQKLQFLEVWDYKWCDLFGYQKTCLYGCKVDVAEVGPLPYWGLKYKSWTPNVKLFSNSQKKK